MLSLRGSYQARNRRGTLAQRPPANALPAGTEYFATDDNGGKWSETDGSTWRATAPGVTELPNSSPLLNYSRTVAFTTTSVYPTFVDVTGFTGQNFTFPASGKVSVELATSVSHNAAKATLFQVLDDLGAVVFDGGGTTPTGQASVAPAPPAADYLGTPGSVRTLRLQVCANSAGTVSVGGGVTKASIRLRVMAA